MVYPQGPYEYLNKWIGLDADTRPDQAKGKTKAKKGDLYFVSDTGFWEKYNGKGTWKVLPAKHGGAGGTLTWDSSNKGPDQVLSNGDMTVTGGVSADYEHVWATASKDSGKLYFEVEVTQAASDAYEQVGITVGNGSNEAQLGAASDDWAWFNYLSGNCRHYNNGSYNSITGGGEDGSTPYIIMVAVDFGNLSVWFGKNNTWYGGTAPDPATNTEAAFTNIPFQAALYPAAGTYESTNSLKLQAHADDLTYSPPSGFSAWDS